MFIMFFIIYPFWAMPNEEMKKLRNTKRDREPENFETAYNGVLEAVQNGTISEERINDSLRRIYRIKYADKLEQ